MRRFSTALLKAWHALNRHTDWVPVRCAQQVATIYVLARSRRSKMNTGKVRRSSRDASRLELVNMIGRLRAAYLVDMPDLPKDRQAVAKQLLADTDIANNEAGSETAVTLFFDEREGVLTIKYENEEEEVEIDLEANADTFDLLCGAFEYVRGGASFEPWKE